MKRVPHHRVPYHFVQRKFGDNIRFFPILIVKKNKCKYRQIRRQNKMFEKTKAKEYVPTEDRTRDRLFMRRASYHYATAHFGKLVLRTRFIQDFPTARDRVGRGLSDGTWTLSDGTLDTTIIGSVILCDIRRTRPP